MTNVLTYEHYSSQVVYRDKGAAARRIPATFGRRELQATIREILISRAIGNVTSSPSEVIVDPQIVA